MKTTVKLRQIVTVSMDGKEEKFICSVAGYTLGGFGHLQFTRLRGPKLKSFKITTEPDGK